jgi:hypothetical protein
MSSGERSRLGRPSAIHSAIRRPAPPAAPIPAAHETQGTQFERGVSRLHGSEATSRSRGRGSRGHLMAAPLRVSPTESIRAAGEQRTERSSTGEARRDEGVRVLGRQAEQRLAVGADGDRPVHQQLQRRLHHSDAAHSKARTLEIIVLLPPQRSIVRRMESIGSACCVAGTQ